jgi:Domain of unknown function (DUF4326)
MITVRNRRTYSGPGYYIGRPSIFGNPFSMADKNDLEERKEVIKQYRKHLIIMLRDNEMARDEMRRLVRLAQKGDLNLVCWCAPLACHGDVLKECIESIILTGQWEGFTL